MALVSVSLSLGEWFEVKGRRIRVTPMALQHLPSIRDELIDVARAGQTITYGELKERLNLPWAVNGLGRALDLLSVDCERRGEPSLAALVVTQGTGEVGSDFDGDPVAERAAVYARERWQ